MMITDPAEEYFKDGLWGWVATRWRKLQMLWGYTDVYAERLVEYDDPEENDYLQFSEVPAGEVWVITHMAALSTTATVDTIEFEGLVGGIEIIVTTREYPFAGLTVEWSGHLILKEGDAIGCEFDGCDSTDDIEAYMSGYKMKVAG